MMTETFFETRVDAIDMLKEQMEVISPGWKGNEQLTDSIYELVEKLDLIRDSENTDANSPDQLNAIIKRARYAIRNDDIKLVDAVVAGLAAAASANFFADATKTIPAVVGVIGACLKLGRDLLHGARLSENELLVLLVLKRQEPAEWIELVTAVQEANQQIDEKQIERILGDLSQKEDLLKKKAAFIAKTTDSRWITLA